MIATVLDYDLPELLCSHLLTLTESNAVSTLSTAAPGVHNTDQLPAHGYNQTGGWTI